MTFCASCWHDPQVPAEVEVAWPGRGWIYYCIPCAGEAERILRELGSWTGQRALAICPRCGQDGCTLHVTRPEGNA